MYTTGSWSNFQEANVFLFYFKNFFQTKKNYPQVYDDYSTPMQYFQFERFVNSENKIIKIDNNETHYISKFEYN